jgi:hypothetical protein
MHTRVLKLFRSQPTLSCQPSYFRGVDLNQIALLNVQLFNCSSLLLQPLKQSVFVFSFFNSDPCGPSVDLFDFFNSGVSGAVTQKT